MPKYPFCSASASWTVTVTMELMSKWNLLLFFLSFKESQAAIVDAYVVHEIKDFENCWHGYGKTPSVNIKHKEDYESIAICWRIMTTAYPHCRGTDMALLGFYRGEHVGDLLWFAIYGPISGMSEDGKHAGWLGISFNTTYGGKGTQVPWRSILYNNPLNIYEWQSFCVSYSKETQKLLMLHNGIKYLDYLVEEQNIVISKHFLEELQIGVNFRGSFSDLQVYSEPMDETALKDWTMCEYDKEGDVYDWDVNKFNMTHDDRIISSIGKVDTKLFCKSKGSDEKEIHLFGDNRVDPISNIEANLLCQRLNGKVVMLPTTIERIEMLLSYLRYYQKKTNHSKPIEAWVGGVSKLDEQYGTSHWYPPNGRYLLIDPKSGKILTNEENRELMRPDIHTYQKLVNLCAHMTYNPDHAPYNIAVQKCSRQIIGRVLCEFDTTPVIRIKGLCKQSSMDRYFQLIEPKIGEGNYNVFLSFKIF